MSNNRILELLTNPSVMYVLADSLTRCVEATADAKREAVRARADAVRRLWDLALGTALGAMGMAFALVFAGAWL